MDAQLKVFLEDCKVEKDTPFTHTTMRCELGDWFSSKYYISGDYIEEFWRLYCNLVSKKLPCVLLEKPGAFTPLRVDFDFKAPLEVGLKRQYTTKMLKAIINIYQNEIKSIIEPDMLEDRHLWCLVLEKPGPRLENEKIKDGFHLHFPHFITTSWIQDFYLRDRVIVKMMEKKIWKDCIFTTKIEDIIDERMAGKTWMMYGSMNYKSKESRPYLYNRWETVKGKKWGHAFDHNLNEVSLNVIFEEEMVFRKTSLRYNLPRFLSVRGWTVETPLKDEIEKRSIVASKKKRRPVIIRKKNPETIIEELKFIRDREILDMLSDSRADNYADWIDVGWILFNIGEGCEDALQMWIDFSKRSSKFVEGECDDVWSRMEIRNKNMGSLMYLAKLDSPKEYKRFQDETINNDLYHCSRLSKINEYIISQIVIKAFQNRFICADAKKDIWYEYRGHKWVEDNGSISLKKIMSEDIHDLFRNYESRTIKDCEDEDKEGAAEAKIIQKRLQKAQDVIHNAPFQRRIIEMCKLEWYNRDFYKKINENRYLLGCENGVIDLELGTFRDGRPDDYITYSTGLYYNTDYNSRHPDIQDLDEFLLKIFPNRNLREYFLDFLCGALQGNKNKIFLIMSGSGNNGKSVTMQLLELTFGTGADGYFGKFPRELIISSRGNSSGQCRPELARVRGKKFMAADEVTHKEELNIGEVKRLTGNDSIYARTLHEKGDEIKPQFTLIIQCLAEGTFVTLYCGISIPIEEIKDNINVLAWDEKCKGIKEVYQKGLIDQGEQECIKLYLLDGTTITCTLEHRFLTNKGEWIEAKNISLYNTKLVKSLYAPQYDDIKKSNFTFGKRVKYKLNTFSSIMESMTLCRILGKICSEPGNIIQFVNDKDVTDFVKDVKFLSKFVFEDKIELNVKKSLCCYQVFINEDLNSVISDFLNRKQVFQIPDFLMNDKCPKYLIREFIASLFGHVGYITKNKLCQYGLSFLVNYKSHITQSKDIKLQMSNLLYLLNDSLGLEFGNLTRSQFDQFCICTDFDNRKTMIDFISTVNVRYEADISIFFASMLYRHNFNKYNLIGRIPNIPDKLIIKGNSYFEIPVVYREFVGPKKVYDLSIEEPYSNFLANDIVVHNCNTPPKVPSDDATWNRIRILDFESEFVFPRDLDKKRVPSSLDKQIKAKKFIADVNMERKLPDLANALLWKIVHRFKDFKERGLKEPPEVLLSTERYKINNDVFTQFVNEKIEKIDDTKHMIRVSEIYSEFQDWYRLNYPSYTKEKVGCSTLKKELNKRLGIVDEDNKYGWNGKAGWLGYKIVENEEENAIGLFTKER